jgi:hypothetical protein
MIIIEYTMLRDGARTEDSVSCMAFRYDALEQRLDAYDASGAVYTVLHVISMLVRKG